MKRFIVLLFSFFLISALSFAQDNSSRTNMVDTWTPVEYHPNGADAIFTDDMNGDNTVVGIMARGWFFDDVDGAGTTTTFQGNPTVFTAYEGPDDGYLGENFNGAFGGGLLIDQWLISPEVTVSAGDTLKFWQRSPDGSTFPDPLQVWVSTTAGTTAAAFDVQIGAFTGSTTGWWQFVEVFPMSGTVRFAVRYYTTNGGPGGSESDYIGLDYFEVISASGGGTITIAEAIEDLNMDFVPDRLGQIVTVEGVVFSPNYQTTHNSFYISDGTAGTDIFMYGPPQFTWAMGDMLQITGEVDQYNGMTEIIPADSSGWVFMSSGNPTPNPIVLTLAQYKANSEMYEGSLVGFVSLTLVGGTWPASGSTNLDFSDGIDTVVFRIDSDTDIPGQPEPTWPRDIIGIGSQFDSSTPPDGGYQIFPRFYATDFLPAGTIPVELTSFVASVNENNVTLSWSTATETNNQGFEIQRSNGNEFLAIGFVSGNGTTTEVKTYSYTDRNLAAGSYSYRLKQVDFDGTFAYSDVVNADVTAPVQFELSQNYPNPFNPSTTINFSIPQSSIVTLKVFNTLGQEVKTLVNQNMESGVHSISFDASDLNSGIYFYRLDAGQFSEVRKMTLIK